MTKTSLIIAFFGLGFLAGAEGLRTSEASEFCGCVERDFLRSVPVRNWNLLDKAEFVSVEDNRPLTELEMAEAAAKIVGQCNRFCEAAAHFTVRAMPRDQYLCRCYAHPLRVFGCEEVEGVGLVRIHCKAVLPDDRGVEVIHPLDGNRIEVRQEEEASTERDAAEEETVTQKQAFEKEPVTDDVTAEEDTVTDQNPTEEEDATEKPVENQTEKGSTHKKTTEKEAEVVEEEPRSLTFHRNMLAMIKNGFKKVDETGHFFASRFPPTRLSGQLKVIHEEKAFPLKVKDDEIKAEEAYGIAALVLGLVALACLAFMVMRVWCEHKAKLKKARSLREERESSAESGSSSLATASTATSHVSITEIVGDAPVHRLGSPPPRPPPPARTRLNSLGDTFVYEKL